uniref:cDNA FLJ46339 fis, clone TESTI4046450 n=1 Tax=Homo sapiens TaxID=9606 RepID=Q6ZRI4_HUMAN|nr:unnamed protein product [Homo sapiens]
MLLVHFHIPPVHLAPPFKFLEDSSSRISKSTNVFDLSDKCIEKMLTYAVLPLCFGYHKGKGCLSRGQVTCLTLSITWDDSLSLPCPFALYTINSNASRHSGPSCLSYCLCLVSYFPMISCLHT